MDHDEIKVTILISNVMHMSRSKTYVLGWINFPNGNRILGDHSFLGQMIPKRLI